MAHASGPSNAPSRSSATSSATAHGSTTSKSKKLPFRFQGSSLQPNITESILKSSLVVCEDFFKADFQQKGSFLGTYLTNLCSDTQTLLKAVYLKPVGCWQQRYVESR